MDVSPIILIITWDHLLFARKDCHNLIVRYRKYADNIFGSQSDLVKIKNWLPLLIPPKKNQDIISYTGH
jgi:hypothetical protein